MSRQDRLFSLLQTLRDGAWHPAHQLALDCGVSERTIWRDMALLAGSGLPVEGNRGQGYRLSATTPLPPLALSALELEALRLGLATVADQADPDLQSAARSLLDRIGAALPGHDLASPPASGLGRAPFARAAAGFRHMPLLRQAILRRLVLKLTVDTPSGETVTALLRPLRMDYLGGFWSLTGWNETRLDFDVFQVDRIRDLSPTGAQFEPEPGQRIEDYLARFAGGGQGN